MFDMLQLVVSLVTLNLNVSQAADKLKHIAHQTRRIRGHRDRMRIMFDSKEQEEATNDSTTTQGEMTEAEIDEVLKESFPASDPPSWTLGVEGHDHIEDSEDES